MAIDVGLVIGAIWILTVVVHQRAWISRTVYGIGLVVLAVGVTLRAHGESVDSSGCVKRCTGVENSSLGAVERQQPVPPTTGQDFATDRFGHQVPRRDCASAAKCPD